MPEQAQIYCLCAAWCGTCRDFRTLLEALVAQHLDWQLHWVDVEDQADRVGDLDIETFPTLLLAVGGEARFLGPVLPQAAAVQNLLLHAPGWRAAGPLAQTLLVRLRPGQGAAVI